MSNMTRRNFIKSAGMATVAATALSSTALAAEGGMFVTKSATTMGFGGDVTVTLTVDTVTGAVADAVIEGAAETPSRGGRACEVMQQEMIDAASIDVAAVGGATVTSNAISVAAKNAYDACMGIERTSAVVGGLMAPGEYTGYAKGYWQIWDLPVTVKVNENAILKISVPTERFDHGETEVILQNVQDLYFPRIIENQSISIDAVAGATASCNAVRNAMKQALEEAIAAAGNDPAEVSRFMQPVDLKTELGQVEDVDVDVLVVGLGAGGLFALESAMQTLLADSGNVLVSVLGLDHAGKVGGKSALTHEGISVNPPKYQALVNGGEPFVDAENFHNIWIDYCTDQETGELLAKEECIDLMFQESGNTIDWMYDLGYRFGTMSTSNFTGGKTSYNVVLTSNTDAGTYEDRRKVLDEYFKSIIADVKAHGGDVWVETEGYELIMDGDRVAGVKARNIVTGKEYNIYAKAVIMNTGGFLHNQELCNTLLDPRWRGDRRQIGTDQDTGLMIKAAIDAGAGTYNIEMTPNVMHVTLDHWLTQYPFNFYEDLLDGRTGRNKVWTLNNIPMAVGVSATTCMVNKLGERLCDEAKYESFAPDASEESWPCYQSGDYFWSIVGDEQMQVFATEGFNQIPKFEGYCSQGDIPKNMPVPEVYEGLGYAIAEGLAAKGETVAELAEAIGADPAVLQATLDKYNEDVAAGEDTVMHKKPEYLTPIQTGPFYAVKIYTAAFSTAGGLDVDSQIRVLNTQGEPMPGLYAVGVDSMGVILNPKRNYNGFGGTAQGWLWTSGRLAGVNAAKYVEDNFGITYVDPALVDIASYSTTR